MDRKKDHGGEMSSKYHSKKVTIDGITFDSQKEAMRYQELLLLQRAGAIDSLHLQVKFTCDVKNRHVCNYYADFTYHDKVTGMDVVEDVKGYRTPEYIEITEV